MPSAHPAQAAASAGSPLATSAVAASPIAAAVGMSPPASSTGDSTALEDDWQTQSHPQYAPFASPLHYVAWTLNHSGDFPREHRPEVLGWLHKGVLNSRSDDEAKYKTILNQVANFHPLVGPQLFRAKDGTALAWVRCKAAGSTMPLADTPAFLP